ncbi:hypothetical protein [Rhodococcus gannanensis]|uniref:Uncharacterized protein n=1 Tax=Rhodococcus gannanensis TaxID=1960308 RepID=A0ABW4NYX6_9NOCA
MTDRSTVRVAHLDVMHSHARITTIVGPVELPPADVVADRLAAMTAIGPKARLGLRPSTTSNRWTFDPVAHRPVVTTTSTPASPMDLLDLPDATDPAEDRPTSVVLAGNYLRTDHNHGLGEVAFALLLHGVILGTIDPADPNVWRPALRRGNGIAAAAVRTFGSDPRRLWALRNSLSSRRTPPPSPVEEQVPWTPDRAAVFSPMSPETLARLRAWRDTDAPGTSMFAVVASALHRALADAGLDVDDVATVTLDVRKYLAEGHVPLANFVSGLEFELGRRPSPQVIHRTVADALESGRPVANVALNSLRTRIGLRTGRPPVPTTRPRSARARLLFSSIGRVPRQGAIPWRGTADPFYMVHNDPTGPEGITVSWAVIDDSLFTAASFHGNVFDRGRVQRALDSVTSDPLRLLR